MLPSSSDIGPELPAPLPAPAGGRSYAGRQRVRWGDVDTGGRLRLYGTARYLQDLSHDDTLASGTGRTGPWVVRRTTIDVVTPAVGDEDLELVTFCGGLGSRWAERRTSITGSEGARIEAMSLWIRIDGTTGRPTRLDPAFLDLYADFTGDRKVGASLTHGDPPASLERRPWPLRVTDLDPMNHVNNAATWEPVVEELARHHLKARRAQVEYRAGIDPGDDVEVVTMVAGGMMRVWLEVDRKVRASAVIHPRPSDQA